MKSLSGYDAIHPLLSRLGLDTKEIDAYLVLLPLGTARATDVAKATGQSRSHTYLVLRSLKEKGLASEVERGKIIHFVAEPPEKLLALIDERTRELASLTPLVEGMLPMLAGITKPLVSAPHVTTMAGKSGMRQLLLQAGRQEFVGMFNPAPAEKAFGGNIAVQLFGKGMRLRGRELLVPGPAAERYMAEVTAREGYEARLLPKGTTFDADTIVFGDTVALLAYDAEHTIIRIRSANIANAFRAWFEVMWSASKAR